ncbi:MAG: hypothetical protein EA353_12655 [Puniceicoccaceae bacterium]|nr:MAG: hypothetical protein EA353_12655 [Puniceicoccaceae bacterium]
MLIEQDQTIFAIPKKPMRKPYRPAPFIVEFTGVAGVGKTVLARKVNELLSQHSNPPKVVSKHDRLTVIKALLSPRAIFHTIVGLTVLIKAGPGSPGRFGRQANKWVRIQYKLWGCGLVSAVHLLDHGFFQTLRGIGGSKTRDIRWIGERLFAHITRPDLVVVLVSDAETISLRRRGRGKILSVLDPAGPKNAVSRMPEFTRLVEAMAARHGTMVLSLYNGPNDDLGRMAETIFHKILEMTNRASDAQ